MSHDTGNDLESSDILDFSDNCENLDVLMNADQDYWTDRLGNKRPTIDYALRMAGFTPAGFDFTTGGVLKNGDRNKCVFNQADQTWYSWSGDLPYNVIAGSVPGEGWKVVNRNALTIAREALRRTYQEVGLNLVDGSFEQGAVVNYFNDVVLHELTGNCYGWGGPFPKVVAAGSGVAGWESRSNVQGGGFSYVFANVSDMQAGKPINGAVGDAFFQLGQRYCTGRTNWKPVTYPTQLPLSGTSPQLYAKNITTIWANDFGAIGDGVNDDQLAINNAIAYINPYVFKSSAGEIRDFSPNRKGGKVKLAPGSYRVTQSILLNPFIVLEGECGIGFSSAPNETGEENSTGVTILADFGTNTNRFVIDTAPWVIATQTRDNGIGSWTGAEIDAGVVSSVRGVEIHNITLAKLDADSPNVFGAVRLGAAQNHYCTRIHVESDHFKVGLMRFAAWGGAVNNCYLRATHIGMATVETTISDAKANYISVRQDVQDFSGFPAWYTSGDDSVWDKDRGVGVLSHNSTVDIGGTIIEGSYRGIVAKAKSVVTGNVVYAEAVAGTVTDCIGLKYATHGLKECSFININTLDAHNTANVFSAFFGEINCNQLTGDIAGGLAPTPTFAANVSSTSKIKFYGGIQRPAAGGDFRYLSNQTYYPNVSFMEVSDRSLNTFYVSSTGDDSKMGVSDGTSLATIDEAVKRAVATNKDADILIKGDAVYTIDMFDHAVHAIKKRVRFIKNSGVANPSIKPKNSGANTNGFIFGDGAVIEFSNVDLLHTLTGTGLEAGFDSMIECIGTVCIRANGCFWDGLSGVNRPFFGTKYKQISKLSVQLNECSLTNIKMSSNSDSTNGRMIVDLIALNTTKTSVTTWSSQVQVLHSDI